MSVAWCVIINLSYRDPAELEPSGWIQLTAEGDYQGCYCDMEYQPAAHNCLSMQPIVSYWEIIGRKCLKKKGMKFTWNFCWQSRVFWREVFQFVCFTFTCLSVLLLSVCHTLYAFVFYLSLKCETITFVMPQSPVVHIRFDVAYCFHVQDRLSKWSKKQADRMVWCSGSSLERLVARISAGTPDIMSFSRGFTRVPPCRCVGSTSIKPRPFPSKSFLIHPTTQRCIM
jgi:hypothetical protein